MTVRVVSFFLIVLFYSVCDAITELHGNSVVGSVRHKLRQRKSPLFNLEVKEIEEGKLATIKAIEATERGDRGTAAHQFSSGAEKFEAASNDAKAEVANDKTAPKRVEDEHKLAERLEQLAEENRRSSANAERIENTSTPESKKIDKKDEAAKDEEADSDNHEGADEEWTLGEDDENKDKDQEKTGPNTTDDWVGGNDKASELSASVVVTSDVAVQ